MLTSLGIGSFGTIYRRWWLALFIRHGWFFLFFNLEAGTDISKGRIIWDGSTVCYWPPFFLITRLVCRCIPYFSVKKTNTCRNWIFGNGSAVVVGHLFTKHGWFAVLFYILRGKLTFVEFGFLGRFYRRVGQFSSFIMRVVSIVPLQSFLLALMTLANIHSASFEILGGLLIFSQ